MLSNAALPAFHSAYVLYAAKANGRFRAGLLAQIHTKRSGSRPGSGLRRTALTTLKIAVLPPIPRASAAVASAVTPGLRASIRKPKRMSWSIWLLHSTWRPRIRPYELLRSASLHGPLMLGLIQPQLAAAG